MNKSITEVTMVLAKSTKGTFVYSNPDSYIPTLYIRKDAFNGDDAPKSITVRILEE